MFPAILYIMCVCVVCVQVYGEGVESLRVTTAVECVGVLSKHPLLTHFEEEEEEEGGESVAERSAHCPPPSLVPRLHCILVTPLLHNNPLLPRGLPHPLPAEGKHTYTQHSMIILYTLVTLSVASIP